MSRTASIAVVCLVVSAFGGSDADAQDPAVQATKAKVAEGLKLAEAAKLAIVETYSGKRGPPAGVPIVAYAGTGKDAHGSYGYTFVPSALVASISIAGVNATPKVGDGKITITFSPMVGVTGLVIHLTPGSGVIANGQPATAMLSGYPIVWGCDVDGVTQFFPYVPEECRF